VKQETADTNDDRSQSKPHRSIAGKGRRPAFAATGCGDRNPDADDDKAKR
jgi:hypothetical protein